MKRSYSAEHQLPKNTGLANKNNKKPVIKFNNSIQYIQTHNTAPNTPTSGHPHILTFKNTPTSHNAAAYQIATSAQTTPTSKNAPPMPASPYYNMFTRQTVHRR